MTAPRKHPGVPTRSYRTVAAKHAPEVLDRIAGPATKTHRKVEDARIRRVFAERMYKARVEINGWTQLHAAKLLGFSNSSALAKIEMGESFDRIIIVTAARVYRVSTDFLLGVSDFEDECRPPGTEWEADIRNSNTAFFQAAMGEHARALAEIARTTGVTVDGLAKVTVAANRASEVFARLQEINPEAWAEVRGGTRLEAAIAELNAACQDVKRTAARARVELQTSAYAAGVTEVIDAKLLEACH